MRCDDDDDDDVHETGMDFCLTFRNGYLNKLNEIFFSAVDRFSFEGLLWK